MSKSTQELLGFRADINGLRAWAVTAVVLYHFGVRGFDGGFVGVDVFFVISGFLMTGVIVASLENARFSFFDFFLARARRIMPALIVLCAAVILAGWFILMPPDFKTLTAHATYSLAFVSNIEYWMEAGYFDASSHEKWLLHTWSLSAEWQFYMVLPVLLWVTWKLKPGRNAQLAVVAASAVLSLAFSIWRTPSDPTAAFFLLPSRAWEMLLGGLVWLAPATLVPAAFRRIVHIAGLGLIGASILLFDKSSAWPGWLALLPVCGAAMVILSRFDSVLVSSALPSWLGERSYSIYLWHWPVVVLLAYLDLAGTLPALLGGLALTLVLGHASYHMVEKTTIRLGRQVAKPRFVLGQAAALMAVALPAVLIWRADGVPGRFAPEKEALAKAVDDYDRKQRACHSMEGERSRSCTYGSGARRVVVLGDSHAAALMPSLSRAADGAGVTLTQWSYSACPYVPGMRKTPQEQALRSAAYRCDRFLDWAGAELGKLPADVPVVLIGRYAGVAMGLNEDHPPQPTPNVYFSRPYSTSEAAFLEEFGEQITRSACALAKERPVYMVRPIPEMGVHVPKVASRRAALGMPAEVSIDMAAYLSRNAWVLKAQDAARAQCGVTVIDPLPLLCPDGRCHGTRDGVALYHDDDHLSLQGSALIAPLFKRIFTDPESVTVLARNRTHD